MSADAQPKLLWEPSAAALERAVMTRYLRWLEADRGLAFDGYDALWGWSTSDLEGFWGSVWDFFDVRSPTPHERVLADRTMPGTRWFEGAQVNYAEHVFRGKQDAAVAIVEASELRDGREWTWGELRALTAGIAGGLRAAGVGPGDRVAAYLPNVPETVAALLACASLGAVWSSCSPDFGAKAVTDRFAQIEPTVLLCVDGYRYGGRDFDRRDVVAALQHAMPSLRRTVVLPYLREDTELDGAVRLEDFVQGDELTFVALPFDHPLWVLYSSGTTGLPKAIVHGHGGMLLEHLKTLHLHVDAQAGDRVFWFTTTGWMMWNFLVGALLTEAAIVTYEGSPAAGDLGVLWDLAERVGITCFGTSAAYVGACMKAPVPPTRGRDLGRLRAVGSTGSPLSPEGFRWVYDHVGQGTWLFSMSGGSDVCTAFVGGVPLLPVFEGELQARALGAKVEAFDAEGRSVIDEVGELVLTEPLPSMPLFLWGDEDGERLRESYFDTYPGIWRHGDWIEITRRGTAIISGRSDSTINRGGVRMGTSEIYRAVLALDEVVDALVVDVPRDDGDAWMPMFVVLREGAELDDDLRAAIARRIREDASPRHVPDELFRVEQVPRTLSGKVLEIPVKRILMGTPPDAAASRDSLADPAALDPFVELARRRS